MVRPYHAWRRVAIRRRGGRGHSSHAAFSPRSHSVDLPVSAPAGKPTYMAKGGGIGDFMAASSSI